MIENALATGINSMGADVYFCGPIPSSAVAYLTRSMRVDAGIMISASHNSYEDNGIKIFASDGFKLLDEVEQEIEALMEPGAISKIVEPAEIGKAKRIDDALGRYIVQLKNAFPRDLTLDGVKIGLDCANGAAYLAAPHTFDELGADIVIRGNSPNGKNINAGFGSEYPEIIRNLVLEHNLDFGLALDGDADRAVIIDRKGHILDGDSILALCAIYMKSSGMLQGNRVVGTVMTNMGLEQYLKEHGIELIRASVGDRYVMDELLKNNCNLGGEQSGHMIFLDRSTCGDGILTALMILEIMLRNEASLAELASGFQPYPQKIVNVKVTKKPELSSIDGFDKILKTD